MISLVCSDFPRVIVLEAVKCLKTAAGHAPFLTYQISESEEPQSMSVGPHPLGNDKGQLMQMTGINEPILFELFEVQDLLSAVELNFQWLHFFDDLRRWWHSEEGLSEPSSPPGQLCLTSFDINLPVDGRKLWEQLCQLSVRKYDCAQWAPPKEVLLEVLLIAHPSLDTLKDLPIVIFEDVDTLVKNTPFTIT